MKQITVILLALLLVPITFTPQASAQGPYTWTTIDNAEIQDTTESTNFIDNRMGSIVKASATHTVTAYAGSDAAADTSSSAVKRCSATNCPVGTVLATGAPAGVDDVTSVKLHYLSDSVLYGCSTFEDTLRFHKSTDGGIFWSNVLVASGLGNAEVCDVGTFDGSHYLISIGDTVVDDHLAYISTTGGTTGSFSAVTNILNQGGFGADITQAIFAWNDTAYTAYVTADTGNGHQCDTVNSGASWVCVAGVLGGFRTSNWERFGTQYFLTYTNGANGDDYANFAKKADQNSDIVITAAYSVVSGTTEVCTSDVAVFSATRFAVSLALCAGNQAMGSPILKLSETLDGGQSWTVETVYLAGALTIATPTTYATGVAYLADGRLITAVQLVFPDNTFVTDGDAANERYMLHFISSGASGADVGDAAATASVTDLVGFDISNDGSIAIARTENGENVRTYNGLTLGTSLSGTIDTNCATSANPKEDGVVAKSMKSGNQAPLIGFLNCDAGGDAQYFSIRKTNGATPSANDLSAVPSGEDCPTGDWSEYQSDDALCPYNIDLADAFGGDEAGDAIDNALGMLGQIRDFPIDYSSNDQQSGTTLDRRHIAWAWASQQCANTGNEPYCDGTEPGLVGVAMLSFQTLFPDDFNQDAVEHHADQNVDDFCLGLDDGNYYLASVVAGQPSHTWTVTFDATSGPSGEALDASISNNPSSFGISGFGVACGGGQILYQNGNSAIQLRERTGTFIDEITLTGGDNRGVAISEEFISSNGTAPGETCTTALAGTNNCVQYGVYYDTVNSEGVVLNLTGGNMVETGRFDIPSGTFHSIRMDRLAKYVWVATSTTIAMFEVTPVTTVVPVDQPGDSEDGEDGVPGDADGDGVADGLEEFGQMIGQLFGVDDPVAGLAIFGIILMLLAGVAGFIVSGGVRKLKNKEPIGSMPPTIAGAFVGVMFFINGVIGLFPGIVTLGGLLVAGVVIFFRVRSGRTVD